MPSYIYHFVPKRPDFLQTMTAEEQQVMADHTRYLMKLHTEGSLLFAGPCLDGAFAIAAFSAASEEVAHEMFATDPAVRAGIVTASLHPFHASFITGRLPALLGPPPGGE